MLIVIDAFCRLKAREIDDALNGLGRWGARLKRKQSIPPVSPAQLGRSRRISGAANPKSRSTLLLAFPFFRR